MTILVVNTRDFGEVLINDDDIVSFEGAIFGFEEYSKYVFLFDKEVSEHFVWLQSVEDESLCFILVDPCLVAQEYNPIIPHDIETSLGDGDLMCWAIAVIKDNFEDSTVNLKSPVVVNVGTKKACQIILENNYPMNHPLINKDGGAE